MNGYKTFTVAILILAGTFGLIMTRPDLPAEIWEMWKWACLSVGGMVGLREVAAKFKPQM